MGSEWNPVDPAVTLVAHRLKLFQFFSTEFHPTKTLRVPGVMHCFGGCAAVFALAIRTLENAFSLTFPRRRGQIPFVGSPPLSLLAFALLLPLSLSLCTFFPLPLLLLLPFPPFPFLPLLPLTQLWRTLPWHCAHRLPPSLCRFE
jgi:hypothetical protein